MKGSALGFICTITPGEGVDAVEVENEEKLKSGREVGKGGVQ